MRLQQLLGECGLAMLNGFYQSLEPITAGELTSLHDCVERLTFNDQGSNPCRNAVSTKQICADARLGEPSSDRKTLTTGRMV